MKAQSMKNFFYWGNQPSITGKITMFYLTMWRLAGCVVAGITYCTTKRPERRQGESLLAFALMEVRHQLRHA